MAFHSWSIFKRVGNASSALRLTPGPRAAKAAAAEAAATRKRSLLSRAAAGLAGLGFASWVSIVVGLVLAGITAREVGRAVVRVEVVAVPKDWQERGYTGLVLSRRVKHFIEQIDDEASAESGPGQHKAFLGADERELPSVEIPGTKLSLDAMVNALREVVNNKPVTVQVAVRKDGEQARAELWTTDAVGGSSTHSLKQSLVAMDSLAQQIAEAVVAAVDPSKLALYRLSRGRRLEIAEVLQECVDNAQPKEKARCLTTWADIQFDGTHLIEAAEKYHAALSWDPKSAPAMSGMGSLEMLREHSREAEQLFRDALREDGSLRSARLGLSSLIANVKGDLKLAEREARAAIDSGPSSVLGLTAQASLLFRLGRDEEGKAAISAAIERDPRSASPYSAWAYWLMSKGNKDEANQKFETALRVRISGRKFILVDWANSLQEIGDYAGAAEKYKKALALDPDDADLLTGYAYQLIAQGKLKEAEYVIKKADPEHTTYSWTRAVYGTLQAHVGHVDAARRTWDEAARQNPQSGNVFNEWGLWLQWEGRFLQAADKHQLAVQVAPGVAWYHANLGYDFSARGQMVQAEAQLREALRLEPRHAYARSRLGYVLARTGRVDAAYLAWNDVIQSNSLVREPYNEWGNWLDDDGRYIEAIKKYRRAIELAPQDAGLHAGLASALFSVGNIDGARQEWLVVLRVDPNNISARAKLASVLAARGQVSAALGLWKTLIAADKEAVDPYAERSSWRTALGDCAGALDDRNRAAAYSDGDAWRRLDLANTYICLGRNKDAINTLDTEQGRWPTNAAAQSRLALLYAEADNIPQAKTLWNELLAAPVGAREANREWGNWLNDKGQYRLAAERHEAALKFANDDAWNLVNLANDLLALNDRTDAELRRAQVLLKKATELDPSNGYAMARLGIALALDSKCGDAGVELTHAAKASPGLPDAFDEWGSWAYSNAVFKEAERLHRLAVARSPRGPWLHAHLGDDLAALGRKALADKEYAQARRLLPNNVSLEEHIANAEASRAAAIKAGVGQCGVLPH